MKVTLKPLTRGAPPDEITLEQGKCLIGRSDECDCKLANPTVSRRHCEFVVQDNTIQIRDLNSSNGTFVNHSRVDKGHRVSHGDIVSLGDASFEVSVSNEFGPISMQAMDEPLHTFSWPTY